MSARLRSGAALDDGQAVGALARRVLAALALGDEVGERRGAEDLPDGLVDLAPQALGRAGSHAHARLVLVEAGDGREAALEELHDLEAVDLVDGPGEAVPAARAADRLDDPRAPQRGEDLLEVLLAEVPALGHGPEAHGLVAGQRDLDQRAHAVLSSRRDPHGCSP